jgi:hypothetical protein
LVLPFVTFFDDPAAQTMDHALALSISLAHVAKRHEQSPQETSQLEYQFSFDGRLRVKVGRHRHFEGCIVLGIFEHVDDGFCRQSMTKGVAT